MKRVKYLFATLLFMIMAIPAMAATAIIVRGDMTVLWGNDGPERVYMFVSDLNTPLAFNPSISRLVNTTYLFLGPLMIYRVLLSRLVNLRPILSAAIILLLRIFALA